MCRQAQDATVVSYAGPQMPQTVAFFFGGNPGLIQLQTFFFQKRSPRVTSTKRSMKSQIPKFSVERVCF